MQVEATFEAPGWLGLVFQSGVVPLAIARIAADGLAADPAHDLRQGMVLATVQGQAVEGRGYAEILGLLRAPRPLTLGFFNARSSVAIAPAAAPAAAPAGDVPPSAGELWARKSSQARSTPRHKGGTTQHTPHPLLWYAPRSCSSRASMTPAGSVSPSARGLC
jgi:hypothetical protein